MWAGEQVADLVQLNTEVVDTALSTVDKALAQPASLDGPHARDLVADQILRETLLTVSSDWPFMVSKDSAADYARYRAHLHAHATREIAGALASGRRDAAERLADGWNRADGLFGALDARQAAPMSSRLSRERACLHGDTPLRPALCAPSRGNRAAREDPDGVVGVPAGGDRRARPARASPGDRAGRGRSRRRRAVPPPFGHRSQHAPVVRRDASTVSG